MGKFEVLTPDSKIRCLKLPCTLRYATDQGTSKPYPFSQSPQQRLNQWIAVGSPPGSPAGPRAAGLQELIAKIGVRGARRKDTPVCSGTLQLLAPTCGELIDPVGFTLQWIAPPADAGRPLTVFVGGADSSERKRWNGIPAEAGQYQARSLDDYLAGLQLPDRSTDVTIRLMRTENRDAIRLVRLRSRAEDAEYRRRLDAVSQRPPLSRDLGMLELFLTSGMWSKAAEISQHLLRDAPESLELRKYALVGFCRSDFADEIARLRARLKDAGVTSFCPPEETSR
jgi:hypothetical protein